MGDTSLRSRRPEGPESTDFFIASPPAVDYHTLGRRAMLDFFPERWSRQRNLFHHDCPRPGIENEATRARGLLRARSESTAELPSGTAIGSAAPRMARPRTPPI